MARARVVCLALLALAVPSLALGGEEAPSGPAALSVSASLAGCGLADTQVTCQIDASWNGLDGAEYYTVSVARPDGVVLDLGQRAGTSRAIFVPYVGPGRYSVQVAAWGTPPGEEDPEVLARDRSSSTGPGKAGVRTSASRTDRRGAAGDGRETREAVADAVSEPEPASEPTATERPGCAEPEEAPDQDEPDEATAVTLETEQYDPADADGDDRCALEPGP